MVAAIVVVAAAVAVVVVVVAAVAVAVVVPAVINKNDCGRKWERKVPGSVLGARSRVLGLGSWRSRV